MLSTSSMQADMAVPGASNWWTQYGPVGAIAFMALTTLVLAVKYYLAEKRESERRLEAEKGSLRQMIEAQQSSLATLNKQMVEMVQSTHEETLALLDQQRDDHEKRFQSLLERHILMTEKWAERTQEIATMVAKTIDSLSRKLRDGG